MPGLLHAAKEEGSRHQNNDEPPFRRATVGQQKHASEFPRQLGGKLTADFVSLGEPENLESGRSQMLLVCLIQAHPECCCSSIAQKNEQFSPLRPGTV